MSKTSIYCVAELSTTWHPSVLSGNTYRGDNTPLFLLKDTQKRQIVLQPFFPFLLFRPEMFLIQVFLRQA